MRTVADAVCGSLTWFVNCCLWETKDPAPEVIASSSEAEEEREEHPKVDGEKDPDFSQVIN